MTTDRFILEKFIQSHPAHAARIVERFKPAEIASFLAEITPDHTVALFNYLERNTAVDCMELLPNEQSAFIIGELPVALASLFLRRMKKEARDLILTSLSSELAEPLRRTLQYAENTAGSLMDPLVFTVPEDITVAEALNRVQKQTQQLIYYLYIVNRDQVLSGVINLRELLLANPEDLLSMVMQTGVIRISAEMPRQTVLDHPGWLEYHSLPVVDSGGRFLGAIRYETIRRIEKESRKTRIPRHALAASNALGELYRIGLSGLIRSAAKTSAGPVK